MRTNVTRQFRFRERNVYTFVPGNETSTKWSFRSRERKCMGTKRPGTENETSIIRNAVGFASMRRC